MSARTPKAALLLFAGLAFSCSLRAADARSGLWSAGGVTLRNAGNEYRLAIATADGERRLDLPAGVEVEELFALRQGALLSGRGLSAARSAGGPAPGDLYLALLDGQGLHALPSPARDPERPVQRENAVALASLAGDLEGLVWLEGVDRQSYTIRAAAWDGLRWSDPTAVAAAAPGSQLALGGATLGDGSKLLVWSRFDGHDDEIVAARFADGQWSAARPIAAGNAVPDVTPSVVAVPGGALAAWSRYDGHEYRVVVSRFDGQTWTAPEWAGPAGSTVPFFTRGTSAATDGKPSTWLAFASSQPRGWTAVELDSAGRALRRGTVETSTTARPALARSATGGVRLRWAAGESDVELE
ncbi:MAG: hypothetical protein ABIV06_02850 [Thermoanaerobaculia bacterium]